MRKKGKLARADITRSFSSKRVRNVRDFRPSTWCSKNAKKLPSCTDHQVLRAFNGRLIVLVSRPSQRRSSKNAYKMHSCLIFTKISTLPAPSPTSNLWRTSKTKATRAFSLRLPKTCAGAYFHFQIWERVTIPIFLLFFLSGSGLVLLFSKCGQYCPSHTPSADSTRYWLTDLTFKDYFCFW